MRRAALVLQWFELVFYAAIVLAWWLLPLYAGAPGMMASTRLSDRVFAYFLWVTLGSVFTWAILYGWYLKFKRERSRP